MKFDIFLACAPKDYNKLPYVIDSIVKNVIGKEKIIICSPYPVPHEILHKIKDVVYYTFDDTTVLPNCDRSLWKYRPNWCFQQHLKLFQNITSDWYLTLDCDTIINRPMNFFDEIGKPIWWYGREQLHNPYFVFMAYMIKLARVSNHTYIADMNLMYRPMIEELLLRNGYNTYDSFVYKSQSITCKECHIGEPELYGNYCKKNYPDMYIEKQLKQAPIYGRNQKEKEKLIWNDIEIKEMIVNMSTQDFDTFSLHSWFDEGDQI